MLKLYFSPFTSSLATHIALIECGADHELILRHLDRKETRTKDYLELNPNGKVPALATEDGYVITEVAASLYYLARRYPEAKLWPTGDLQAETDVISWMSFAASTLHGSRAKGPEHIAEAFDVTERKFAGRDWVAGGFTIADIHVFRIHWRFRPLIDVAEGTYPSLEAHRDRMLARPAVQKAIEIERGYE